MDSLTCMHAFDLSTNEDNVQPASCPGSITRSASLETMPPEILDRIVRFVDGKSILPLCHSMPYDKYISAAMFHFGHRFPHERYTPLELWPDKYFPMCRVQRMHAAGMYARIVSKLGGNVHVPCSKNVLKYLGALRDVLSIHSGDISSSSGWAEFLRGLAESKKRIRSCR
ncbi:hypothetical protein HDU77_001247, partial [Chytriomyces hyalinus]